MLKARWQIRHLFIILAFLCLFMGAFFVTGAAADPIDDPSQFVEKMAELIQKNDEKGLVELIVTNKNTSRIVFDNLLAAMETKISQGEPVDSPQMKLVDLLVRAIAIVFKGRLNDESLEIKYKAFVERIAGKLKPKPSPSPTPSPTSKNSYDQLLDYYEIRLARGQIEKGDDEKLNRLQDELLAKKDYPRLIRRGEMVARLQDNVGFFEQSLRIRRRILEEYAPRVKDPDRMIRSCLRLANTMYLSGDVNSAEKYYLQAEKLSNEGSSHMALLGRYISAINLLQIYISRNNTKKLEEYVRVMASAGTGVDRIPKSFAYEAQDFFLLMTSLARLGDTFRDGAILSLIRGENDKAKASYAMMVIVYGTVFTAVKDDKTFLNNNLDKLRAIIVSARGLIVAYRDLGRHQEAVNNFRLMAGILEKIPPDKRVLEDNRFLADTSLQLAETASETARTNRNNPEEFNKAYRSAVEYYMLAEAMSIKIGDNIKQIDARLGLAKLIIDQGDLADPKSVAQMRESLEKAYKNSTSVINFPGGVLQYHILMARYNEKIKNYKAAGEHYVSALDLLEKMVSTAAPTPQERLTMLSQVDFLYRMASEALIKSNQPQKAFEVSERLRGTQVVTSIDISQVKTKDPRIKEALVQVDRLRAETGKTEESLQKEQNRDPRYQDKEKIARLNQTLAKTKGEFYQNINLIRSANPDYERLVSVKPAVFSKIQKKIPGDTLLVQYFPGSEKLYIFIVTADSYKIKTVDVSASELNGLIKTFRASMDSAAKNLERGTPATALNPREPSHKRTVQCITRLYSYLIEPVKPELAGKKVMAVIPTGYLYYLPFHALAREDEKGNLIFFASECQLAYLTSAGLFETVTEKEKSAVKGTALALGDPDGSLKNAAAEAEGLKAVFPDTIVYLKDKATKDRVQNPPGSLSILHLATHSYLDADNVNNSYILTAGSGSESRLTQGEIFNIPLEESSLVTLSACQTALGERLPGSEISSLASAFSIAGTPTILASLWPVADESTNILMKEFYTSLKEGKTKAEAIRIAQLKLIRDPRFANPFYWAPFILIGDWR